MPEIVVVDQKGRVYLVPQSVLAKHCTKIGSMKKGKAKSQVAGQGDDWYACRWEAWGDCGSKPTH